MNTTDASSADLSIPTATTSVTEVLDPQGPVPSPCPQGGHSPARPSSSAVLGEGQQGKSEQLSYTATYSPDDNKLRLYASRRLDAETYARVKSAGFKWAPRQDLFVAPMWTPQREDLLIELAGEIGDEDTSLVDRAEVRAERFEGYGERRAADAEDARKAVAAIADNIPFGQPILVGHHSERHARRDAAKIENGMRKAVQMWKTSEYWEQRAAGSIRHAKYKELPAVRARRIKTIEADKRKHEREQAKAKRFLSLWRKAHEDTAATKRDGSPTTFAERARYLANVSMAYDLGSDLEGGRIDAAEAQAKSIKGYDSSIAWHDRWIAHCDNRLTYEGAMLVQSGYTPPPRPKTKADLPLLNYSGTVAFRNPYTGAIIKAEAVGVTKAELAAIHTDYKGTRVSECGTHRVRTAMLRRGAGDDRHALSIVYLTDSKQHVRPCESVVKAAAKQAEAASHGAVTAALAVAVAQSQARAAGAEKRAEREAVAVPFRAMAQTLKTGVKVVAAPQLFPTPEPLAERMAREADIPEGADVLEPSAGSGNLIHAIRAAARWKVNLTMVELDVRMADYLRARFPLYRVEAGDFREFNNADSEIMGALGTFDRIVMNPPFGNGQDIAHIKHALTFLRPGGRLVAICADGPRQNAELKPFIEEMGGTWEQLPPDAFKDSGTSVRTALISLTL